MKKLSAVVSKVLGMKPENVNDNTSPENSRNWDSFKGLLLISEIEKAFQIKFSTEEMFSMKDVGSIKRILETKHNIKN